MPEELQQVAEAVPASEPVVTATPEAEVSTPPEVPEQPPAKTFTQEEVDAIAAKARAREQRKYERELAARLAEAQARQQPPAPPPEQQPPDQPVDAWQLAERIANQREALKREEDVLAAYQEREESARDKYDDFEQVVRNPSLPITVDMAAAIREAENGPEIAYWLGTHPAEAARIAKLSLHGQARAIGNIETKLLTDPPVKKTTSAPPPISPVSARGSGNPAYDTTDPRSIKTMTTSEWIDAERRREMKRLEAQQLR